MSGPRRAAGWPIAAVLAGLCLAAAACSELNFEPVDARPLEPPPAYRVWWAEVELCTGTEGSFDRVFWYEATEIIDRERGTLHSGAWKPPHSIFIRSGSLSNRRVVKHEMVHDLLQIRSHDLEVFERCAGL